MKNLQSPIREVADEFGTPDGLYKAILWMFLAWVSDKFIQKRDLEHLIPFLMQNSQLKQKKNHWANHGFQTANNSIKMNINSGSGTNPRKLKKSNEIWKVTFLYDQTS